MPISPPAYLSSIILGKDGMCEAYGEDHFHFQQVSLDQGTILRRFEFPDIPGGVELSDVKDNIAVIRGRQAKEDGSSVVIVLDVDAKKVLMRFKCVWSVSHHRLMNHKGEMYIVSD